MHEFKTIPEEFVVQYKDRKKWGKIEELHTHDCYELYYLIEGELIFNTESESYLMRKGSIALFPPGVSHKSYPKDDPHHRRILIYLKESFIREFLELDSKFMKCFDYGHIQLMKVQQKRLESFLDQIMNEFYRDDETRNMVMVKSLLGIIICYINRFCQENNKITTTLEDSIPSGNISRAVSHINNHYANDITLSSTAQALGINPSYLSRSFKAAMDCNFSDYLTNVRINKAIVLLLNSDKNITEIAFEVGYNSSNHFCKAFRLAMGISPLRYRKRA
ncbi:MAG: AraC family transcriptional regulator [Eubacteriales bacterium]|nr:AraC family transcriptional regulator [Eubacteriales bacterium]